MAMEGMERMRKAHESLKAKAVLRDPITGKQLDDENAEEYDKTLADILGDKRSHELFVNRFLYAQKDTEMAKDVVESLANKTLLTQEQETFLEKARASFNQTRLEVGKVKELLTSEEIERIARVDSRIAEISNQIGLQKAEKLLDDQFEDMAISNPKEFQKIVQRFKLLREIREDTETDSIEQRTAATLRKLGIGEDQYWKATISGDTPESRENLRKLVREQYGGFKKTMNFISAGGLASWDTSKLSTNLSEQMQVLKKCDEHLKVIGRTLQGTLTPEVRLAIQRHMIEGGAIEEKQEENNVATIEDYRKVKEESRPEAMKKRWMEYRVQELKKRNIKDADKQPQIVKRIEDDFVNREFARQEQYKPVGLIAALLTLLFGTKEDIRNTISTP